MNRLVMLAVSIAVIFSLISSSMLASVNAVSVTAASATPSTSTMTPIKHVVVIFQENISFDHYFGTYPTATNPAGEPKFIADPNTPSVNGVLGVVFKASFFIVFSWVHNNLSSLPKEEGEQLETEDEEELEEENESPPTAWQGQTEFTKDDYKNSSKLQFHYQFLQQKRSSSQA
jgi:Phosphoesterase family